MHPPETGLFVEVASSRKDDAETLDDGSVPLQSHVLDLLGILMEEVMVLDAIIAQTDQQRADLWKMRESILEAITHDSPAYHMDISLPLAGIARFVSVMDAAIAKWGFQPLTVGHLGDGTPGHTWGTAPYLYDVKDGDSTHCVITGGGPWPAEPRSACSTGFVCFTCFAQSA